MSDKERVASANKSSPKEETPMAKEKPAKEKESFAKFSGLCFLPIVTFAAALMGIAFFFSLFIAHTQGGFGALSLPQDYVFNLVYDFLILFASLGLFFDLLFRHKVSHIAFVLLFALLVNVYCLYYGIHDCLSGEPVGAVFFFLCLLTSVGADVFYVKKTLGGDANLPFWAFSIATWSFFVFASVANYTFFDTYAFSNGSFSDFIAKDFYFWGDLLTMRTVLLSSIAASTVSLQCDFDPKPLKLNDLGQVIYEDPSENK